MQGRRLKRIAAAGQSTLADMSKLSSNPVFLLLITSE